MTKDDSKTHFQTLLDREKISRLQKLCAESIKLMIWVKGTKEREHFIAKAYSEDRKSLVLSGNDKTSLHGKDVLYAFTLNGLNYFGKGRVLSTSLIDLDCKSNLYKSEKRKNFRLLTYPHQKVFLNIKIDLKAQDGQGNVVDFKSGVSQTKLFKNFLDLMGSSEDDLEDDGSFSFRVLDLSVSGIGVIISDLNQELFSSGKIFQNVVLKIKGKRITIPEIKTLYTIDLVTQNKIQKLKKVALEFLNVDDNLDSRLSEVINTSLRDFEADFEEFI